MSYTSEQIDSYLNILEKNKNNQSENNDKIGCKNCGKDNLTIYLGQYVCEECGLFNGYVLGYFDIKEKDRLFYKKRASITENTTMRKRLIKYLKE